MCVIHKLILIATCLFSSFNDNIVLMIILSYHMIFFHYSLIHLFWNYFFSRIFVPRTPCILRRTTILADRVISVSQAAHRRPSFLSTYSFGQKDRRETIDTTASQAVREEKEREDDLETVLDTSRTSRNCYF